MNSMWFTDNAYVDFETTRVCYSDGTSAPIRGNNVFKLLGYLSEHPGRRLSRAELIRSIWDSDDESYYNNLAREKGKLKDLLRDGEDTVLPYNNASKDYRFDAPAQKPRPDISASIAAPVSSPAQGTSVLPAGYLQEELIRGIRTLMDAFGKQVDYHIKTTDPDAKTNTRQIGVYLYKLSLQNSLSVIESLMDLLEPGSLNETERGHVAAVYLQIGNYYQFMASVTKDEDVRKTKSAIAWHKLHLAAGLGNASAMNNIAFSYFRGAFGVTKSPDMARVWYKKAIAAGSDAARFQFQQYFPGEPVT